MSKKTIVKNILLVMLLGIAAWAIIPIFIDEKVSEPAPEQSTILSAPETDVDDSVESPAEKLVEKVRSGSFEGKNNYSAGGTVNLVEDASGTRFVRFEDDFTSDNGPDLIVYIGTANDRGTSLGALKGNIGSQNYEIPINVDVNGVDTVRVFCRSFNVDFAIATL